MVRNKPQESGSRPQMQEAMWRALEHAVIANETLEHRSSVNGHTYRISKIFSITDTQNKAFLYVSNPVAELLAQTALSVKVYDGDCEYRIYDEPTVDETSFSQESFSNLRSDVTADPDQNIYFGYDTDVTVSDTGRLFDEEFIRAGNKEEKSNGDVEYIIGSDSSALLEVTNTSNNTIEVSLSANFYKIPDVIDLQQ